MALPAYSPRAGEIGDAEMNFGLQTLDPSKAGAAFPLLIGAQAARQDAFRQYNANNAYDQALAALQQRDTARNNDMTHLTTLINSKTPGAIDLATRLGLTSGLFAGSDPSASAAIGGITNLQNREAQAGIFKTVAEGTKAGVESGYNVGIPDYTAMSGTAPVMKAPLSMQLEGMRQEGANTRSAAQLLRDSQVTYGLTRDKDGNIVPTASGVHAGNVGEASANLDRIANAPPRTYVGADGETKTVAGNPQLTTSGVIKDRKSGAITSTYNTPLKPATGGSPNTSAPPPASTAQGASLVPAGVMVMQDKTANWSKVQPYAQQYYNWATGPSSTLTPQQQAAVKANFSSGNFGIGVTEQGKKYLTMSGRPVVGVRE